jgi:hypothetical protein
MYIHIISYNDCICMLAFPHGPCVGVLRGSVVFRACRDRKSFQGWLGWSIPPIYGNFGDCLLGIYINVYNTTGCLTRHVTISLAFSASQLFILREDPGLKNCREGHESKFLQFMVTSGFPLRRISLDPMISESSGFEGGSIILVLPGFMWAPGQTVSLDSPPFEVLSRWLILPLGCWGMITWVTSKLGCSFPIFSG